jgi:hypothetical protein
VFRNPGAKAPAVIPEARAALYRLARDTKLYLITQLPHSGLQNLSFSLLALLVQTCFTSTKVQVLTPHHSTPALRPPESHGLLVLAHQAQVLSLLALLGQKGTNTSARTAPECHGLLVFAYQAQVLSLLALLVQEYKY